MAETLPAFLNGPVIEHFPTRAAWLEARRGYGIGSSDVPAIVGVSRFQSALALYHEKLGVTRPSPAYEEHARWGQILEEPIAQRYAEETKRTVENPNAVIGQWSIARHPQHPHMIASVDRFVLPNVREGMQPLPLPGEFGVLEIKNAHLMMRDEWVGEEANNEPPVEYQVQLQHQLAVTGARWGSIAALIGGVIFVWADVARDEALIERLVDMETAFMRRLELRDPPLADGSESSREVLRQLYPKDTGTSVVLPPEAFDWHHAFQDAKDRKRQAKTDEDLAGNRLRQAIGDATIAFLPDGTAYTYKLQSRKETVQPAAEFRVLRLKKGKG